MTGKRVWGGGALMVIIIADLSRRERRLKLTWRSEQEDWGGGTLEKGGTVGVRLYHHRPC
jgi:hypothetical protein